MMVRDILNRLEKTGELCALCDAGVIPIKFIGYREMYLQYDINRKVHGMKSTEARLCVAVKMNCDLSTVHRAIAALERD
jgi:hypothetical protein